MDEPRTSGMEIVDLLTKMIDEYEQQSQEISQTISNLEEAKKTLMKGIKEVEEQIVFVHGREQEILSILNRFKQIRYHQEIDMALGPVSS